MRQVAFAMALAAITQSAHAALFDDDEARKRIADTNARLAQVQKQLEDRISALEGQLRSQGLVDLFNSVEPTPAQIWLTAQAASAADDAGDAYYYMCEYNLETSRVCAGRSRC